MHTAVSIACENEAWLCCGLSVDVDVVIIGKLTVVQGEIEWLSESHEEAPLGGIISSGELLRVELAPVDENDS